MNSKLLSIIAFISVSLLSLVAAIVVFTDAWSNWRAGDAVGAHQRLVKAIHTGYTGQTSAGTGDVTDVLRLSGDIPQDMLNGTIVAFPGNATATFVAAGRQVQLTYSGLEKAICNKLAQLGYDGIRQGGATAVSINGAAQILPITKANATQGCSNDGSGATGAGNGMVFTVPIQP
jgi:hypothetical protein